MQLLERGNDAAEGSPVGAAPPLLHPGGGRSSTVVGQGEVAIDDLGDLLSAVRSRLRRTARSGGNLSRSLGGVPATGRADGSIVAICAGVLECANALDQIQATLARELDSRTELEREYRQTQAALAHALAELAGTPAGERYDRYVAQHDGLTSLPNRGSFLQHLEAELDGRAAQRQSVAVLCIGLHESAPLNDRYGHDMGDELLRIVGFRLARAIRADDMVCRLGGDQFGCLLSNVRGRTQLTALATKLLHAVGAPVRLGKRNLAVHASIGIAVSPDDGVNSADLLRNADRASHEAMRHQTGFAFFDRGAGA